MENNICKCGADFNKTIKLIPFITNGMMMIECPNCRYVWRVKFINEFMKIINLNQSDIETKLEEII